MEKLIWVFVFALLMAGAFTAFSINSGGGGGRREIVDDKDADGERDQPGGPAAGL